jgi:SPP1 family phage portal protein
VFKLTEFVPLIDEENGGIKAGIRFWQIADNKPLRFTLYEIDGYTEYIRRKGEEPQILKDKRPYVVSVRTDGDETEIIDGRNYDGFPIVPFYSPNKQSLIVGMRENIDCYDLIKSGFANDLDEASMLYWTIENAGGMDDLDLVQFVERMKTVKAAVVNGEAGARAEAHTVEVPYQSRETYLERLEADLYRDAMALNVNQISGGNITATAIMAAYDPMDGNANDFEDCAVDFVDGLLALAGYDEKVKYTFKRSRIANQQEETNTVLAAAQFLDHETILRHLPFLSADEIDGILDRVTEEEANRIVDVNKESEEEE